MHNKASNSYSYTHVIVPIPIPFRWCFKVVRRYQVIMNETCRIKCNGCIYGIDIPLRWRIDFLTRHIESEDSQEALHCNYAHHLFIVKTAPIYTMDTFIALTFFESSYLYYGYIHCIWLSLNPIGEVILAYSLGKWMDTPENRVTQIHSLSHFVQLPICSFSKNEWEDGKIQGNQHGE